ncbi:Uncharacterised protein [Mycobacteroides abscessus subsp. abscessus]|nr:Uncharacterised protein [Mycobacteroides abscessus subsp. abscessus]
MVGRIRLEQPGFGVQVVVHRRVEVEVVARQVGETAGGEAQRVHPAQRQRVAGHLHDDGVDTTFDHAGQQRLQRRRFRGGEGTRQVAAVDPDADGADQPGHPPRGAQPRLDQIGGRGLPRGSGDTDDAQPLRGPPVDFGGDFAQDRPRGGVHEHGHTDVEKLQALRVGQHRGGTGRDGVGGEPRTVRGRSGQCREEITGDDVPATQRDTGDAQLRNRSPRLGADVVGQRAQRSPDRVSGAQGRRRHGHDTVPGR